MSGRFARLSVLFGAALLAGCNAVVLKPVGDVAIQQRNLIVIATVLMLLVIVPVIVLTLLFAWRYRASNKSATYAPDWHHSTQLELVIWAAPLLIIIMLGAVTWITTHTLDPYRPVSRISRNVPVPDGTQPLRVQAVALDWKWLFVYPDLGIATVNELAAPINTPINFEITASTVMNSLFIPALAGQVYAMPGMQTRLHAVIDRPGRFEGFSANYSGAGFSDMRFRFEAMTAADFEAWTAATRAGSEALTRASYLQLEQPSIKVAPKRYASVEAQLFDRIVNLCVAPNKMCMRDMMAIDARGGLPPAAAQALLATREPAPGRVGGDAAKRLLPYDAAHARDYSGRRVDYVTALCADDLVADASPVAASANAPVHAR